MLSVDMRARRADGTYRWYTIWRTPRRDENGNIVKWYSIGINIEDKKLAEDALRDSEARLAAAERELRLTLDSIPTLAWRTGADGSAEYLNKRWLDYTGLSQDRRWVGNGGLRFIPTTGRSCSTHGRECLKPQQPGEVEARMRRFDGVYRWFLFRCEPRRDDSGAVVGWYGTNTDIEDRKHAEYELQRSRLISPRRRSSARPAALPGISPPISIFGPTRPIKSWALTADRPSTGLLMQRMHPDDRLKMDHELNRSAQRVGYHDFEIRLLMPDQIKYHLLAHRMTYEPAMRSRRRADGYHRGAAVRRRRCTLRRPRSPMPGGSQPWGRSARRSPMKSISRSRRSSPTARPAFASSTATIRTWTMSRGAVEWIVKDGNRAAEVIRRVRGLMKKADPEQRRCVNLDSIVSEVVALMQSELTRQGYPPELRSRRPVSGDRRRPRPTAAGDPQPHHQRHRGDAAMIDVARVLMIRTVEDRSRGGPSSPWRTAASGLPARIADRCSIRSSAPRPVDWAWACRSAARSSRSTAADCGPPRMPVSRRDISVRACRPLADAA